MTTQLVKDLSSLKEGDTFKVEEIGPHKFKDLISEGNPQIENKTLEVVENDSIKDLTEEDSILPEFLLDKIDFLRDHFTVLAVDEAGNEFKFSSGDGEVIVTHDDEDLVSPLIYGQLKDINLDP